MKIIDINKSELIEKTKEVKKKKYRFILLDAYYMNEKEDKIVLTYSFDKDGEVLTFKLTIKDYRMPSLTSVLGKAVEWCEREINDHYKIIFEGLDTDERFILPEGMATELPTFGNIKITKTEV